MAGVEGPLSFLVVGSMSSLGPHFDTPLSLCMDVREEFFEPREAGAFQFALD
jgi:hypothetical protein